MWGEDVRKLMWFSLGFCLACAVGAYFYDTRLVYASLALLLFDGILMILQRKMAFLKFAVVVILGLAVGFGWFSAYDTMYLQGARDYHDKSASISIIATDYAFDTNSGCCADGYVMLDGKPYQVCAYIHSRMSISPGDTISGGFRFRVTTAGGTNDPTYHQGKGVFLLAYQESDGVALQEGTPAFWQSTALWRSTLIQVIDEVFPQDTAGFAKALLLGQRQDIDYETSTAFKVSGISHIIAVSGLHVSILFALVYTLTGKHRVLTALIGIPIVIFFAGVAGFSPSVVRASIMQILMMLALLFDREYDNFTALSFAALTMLIVNPLVITSVSFQLSAGCMIGIFLFSERIRDWLMKETRLGRWQCKAVSHIGSGISVTVSAMVFTTPLVACYFGAVSLVGILTNLLTLWAVSIVFYGIMAACGVYFISSGVAAALAWAVSWLIRYILLVAKLLSRLPLAAVYTKSIYIVLWLIFCYGLLAVFLVVKKKRVMLFFASAVAGLCLALCLSWAEPALTECRVTVLNVGQGQSVLLQSRGRSFLVDCGGSYDTDVADMAAETLLSQGISRLDGLILTHYDKDHIGGVSYLLSRISTNHLFLPYSEEWETEGKALAAFTDDGANFVSEDTALTFESGNLTIFSPFSYESGNESSMCVLFQTENCAILITGDRNTATENVLIQRCNIPKLDALIVGHHGAASSTGYALLEATRPEFAFISVGKDNPYGHPTQEVLNKLAGFGCKVYRTDIHGTIVFRR